MISNKPPFFSHFLHELLSCNAVPPSVFQVGKIWMPSREGWIEIFGLQARPHYCFPLSQAMKPIDIEKEIMFIPIFSKSYDYESYFAILSGTTGFSDITLAGGSSSASFQDYFSFRNSSQFMVSKGEYVTQASSFLLSLILDTLKRDA